MINKKDKTAYLVGMCGQNIVYAVISAGLSFYFQSVIFLPAMAISLISIISKMIEFVSDPIMGYCIDITRTKRGKCRPYLMYTPIPIGILAILLFMNFQYSSENSFLKNTFIILWAGVGTIIFGILYSAGDVALWSYPSLMANNSDERNRLLSNARVVSSLSGSFIVLIVLQLSQLAGNYFSEKYSNNSKGLQVGTIVVCSMLVAIGTVLFQQTGIFVKERGWYSDKKISLKESFRIMYSCKPFRYIMLSGILRSPYMLMNVVQNTLYIYYFGNNGQKLYILYMVISGGAGLVANLLSSMITPKLAEKHIKSKLMIFGNYASAFFYALLFVLYLAAPTKLAEPLYFAIFSLLIFLLSFSLGIVLSVQSYMIGDAVDYEERKGGYRPDGIFFSGQSMLVKISAGIASVISGIVYTVAGFSGDNISKINTALYNGAIFSYDMEFAKYRTAMFLMMSLIPAIGMFLSVLPIKVYKRYEE